MVCGDLKARERDTPDRNESVATADGMMDVSITRPDGPGPFPVVVQLMDGLGMREELHGHARRVAGWGYCVVAPDLFYRQGLKGPLDFGNPKSRAATTTDAPASAKASDARLPMPRPAPVTIATLPANSFAMSRSSPLCLAKSLLEIAQ
ncbi:MAG: hypothetical protein FJX31_03725 [Alphaproteobacteria bacterium]|nr:hypothetical protein [Alphaproteobacteria bacterium]